VSSDRLTELDLFAAPDQSLFSNAIHKLNPWSRGYCTERAGICEGTRAHRAKARVLAGIVAMIIGERLRSAREQLKLSQGELEKRTGLLRCYISRVENGHTVPAIETLEKLARALEMRLYQLLYDGDEPPQPSTPARRVASEDALWGSFGKDARFLRKLRQLLCRMQVDDRELLLVVAEEMAQKKKNRKKS
jgi:transcriptional regulator with XRE-family HTH domain